MKRFRRWVFNGFAALSLLLFLMAMMAWVHSAFYVASCTYTPPRGVSGKCWSYQIGSLDGRAVCWVDHLPSKYTFSSEFVGSVERNPSSRHWPWLFGRKKYGFGFVGFWWQHTIGAIDYYILAVPDWFIALLSLFLPWRWIRKRRAIPAGYCRICGYDLRATPHRCPECGTIPTSVKSAT